MDQTSDVEPTIQIEAAVAADQTAIWQLLRQCELPLDGLAEHWATALVARREAQVVGSAALELYGAYALLRSVAVAAPYRGRGVGQQLARAALELARRRGVTQVYLLTETAPQFFAALGFQAIGREQVAAPLHQSAEFRGACPDSALAMVLQLAG